MFTRKITLYLICFICFLNVKSQTISTFENLGLASDTFWDGRAVPFGTNFTSGNASFYNYYDTAFGGYWVEGWAYSTKKDTVYDTYLNLFSSITGNGFNSSTYAVGQDKARVKLTGAAKSKEISGMYINNTTYAYKAMKNGNFVAKKFGGTSGNDSDYLRLTIKGWLNGNKKPDSVNFYLADYRNSDNSKDYIVKTWQWVNLISLGNLDSLEFAMTTTDTGQFGPNTPMFFAIDNFTTRDFGTGMDERRNAFKVYPNPCKDELRFMIYDLRFADGNSPTFALQNILGEVLLEGTLNGEETVINVNSLSPGIYFVKVSEGNESFTQKIIKY